jgi:hypothetical protein
MQINLTVSLTKKWMVSYLINVLFFLVLGCVFYWRDMRSVLEAHNSDSAITLLGRVLPLALGVALGSRWPVKASVQHSGGDIDEASKLKPPYQSGSGYDWGLQFGRKFTNTR